MIRNRNRIKVKNYAFFYVVCPKKQTNLKFFHGPIVNVYSIISKFQNIPSNSNKYEHHNSCSSYGYTLHSSIVLQNISDTVLYSFSLELPPYQRTIHPHASSYIYDNIVFHKEDIQKAFY